MFKPPAGFGPKPPSKMFALPSIVQNAKGSQIKPTKQQPTEKPTTGPMAKMTLPEYLFAWAMMKMGYKANEDWLFQHPLLGGRTWQGGSVVDFYLPDTGKGGFPPLSVLVNGEYWHYGMGPEPFRRDAAVIADIQQVAKADVLVVDENDLMADAMFVTRLAVVLRRDISRLRHLTS